MATRKKVDWSLKSLEHVSNLFEYLEAQQDFDKAEAYIDNLFEFGNELSSKYAHYPPCRNKALRTEGFRCARFRKKYIIVYFEYDKKITILAIVHTRMGDSSIESAVFD